MMVYLPPEVKELTEETDPWRAYDPVTKHFYIREEAPQTIKDKYKKLQDIIEKAYAPFIGTDFM